MRQATFTAKQSGHGEPRPGEDQDTPTVPAQQLRDPIGPAAAEDPCLASCTQEPILIDNSPSPKTRSLPLAGATIGWSRGPCRFCTGQRLVTCSCRISVARRLFQMAPLRRYPQTSRTSPPRKQPYMPGSGLASRVEESRYLLLPPVSLWPAGYRSAVQSSPVRASAVVPLLQPTLWSPPASRSSPCTTHKAEPTPVMDAAAVAFQPPNEPLCRRVRVRSTSRSPETLIGGTEEATGRCSRTTPASQAHFAEALPSDDMACTGPQMMFTR